MRKFLTALFLILLFAGHVTAEPIILKLADFAPSNKAFTMANIWLPWVDEMNKAGESMFKIEVYVGGALNPAPPKQLEILRSGVADIAFIVPRYTPAIFTDDAVVEVPFIANNAIDASLAIHNMLQKNMLKNYDTIVPLMVACSTQHAIHSTIPVKTPADLAGKKIWVAGPLQLLMAKSMGAVPLGMPLPGVAASLNQGGLQATIHDHVIVRNFKIDASAKYHCMVPMGTVTILMAMNKESFNKLPQKAQDLFLDKREYTLRLWADQNDKDRDAYFERMKADPEHHVYTPTEAEMELWKKAIEPAVEEWTNKDPRRKALLDTYKAEVANAMK